MNEVCFEVPATTANLGPGFDCLGIALDLHNRVTLHKGSEGAAHEMVEECARAFFQKLGGEPFPFRWEIEGEVPRSRGLGSSVTLRLGLLNGLNTLCGDPLEQSEINDLCVTLEGHPDNALPAATGGFVVAKDALSFLRFEVDPRLQFVLLIPEIEIATNAARDVLPKHIPHREAVQSCVHACRITAAFASGQYEHLRDAFDDFLHQPYRTQLLPFLGDVLSASVGGGALGGFLSGSGSTICAVTLQEPEQVAHSMRAALPPDVSSRTVITRATNHGTRLLRAA